MLRRFSLAIAWLVLLASTASAEDRTDSPSPAEVSAAQDELVQQLGASSFRKRQAATAELVRQGVAAKSVLFEALQDPDLEVRARARHILERIDLNLREARLAAFIGDVGGSRKLELPGWKQFRDLVGDRRETREFFADMTRLEPALLTAYGEGSPELAELYKDRAALIQARFKIRFPAHVIAPQTLATLLLIGCDPEAGDYTQQLSQLYPLLCRPDTIETIRRQARSSILNKLLEAWATNTTTSGRAFYGLSMCLKYDLQEVGLRQATRILAEEDSSSSLQYAIILVGRFGDATHAPLVSKHLENESVCGRWSNRALKKKGTIDTQVRDIALVVLLRMHGKDPKECGFELLRENPETLYHTYTYGFVEDGDREATHTRWESQFKADQ